MQSIWASDVDGVVGCHGGLELLLERQLFIAVVHSCYVWFHEVTVASSLCLMCYGKKSVYNFFSVVWIWTYLIHVRYLMKHSTLFFLHPIMKCYTDIVWSLFSDHAKTYQNVSCFWRPSEFNTYRLSYRRIQQDATVYQNLLFHVYMKLNMFRATHRPSSGA